jgi:hypothetical protein
MGRRYAIDGKARAIDVEGISLDPNGQSGYAKWP